MKPDWIDIIIGTALVWGIIAGYKRGIIMEVIYLLAYIIALIAAMLFFKELVIVLDARIPELHGIVSFLAFTLIFVGIFKAVNFLGSIIKGIVSFTPFGILDNLLGALLAVFKVMMIVSCFMLVCEWLKISSLTSEFSKSIFNPYLVWFTNLIFKSWLHLS